MKTSVLDIRHVGLYLTDKSPIFMSSIWNFANVKRTQKARMLKKTEPHNLVFHATP